MTVRVLMRIDFVPSYRVTLKSVGEKSWSACEAGVRKRPTSRRVGLTIVDIDLISATGHGRIVVPQGQLAEVGKTGSTHPDLKLLPSVQRRQREAFVVGGILLAPIGRRTDLIDRIGSLSVQVLVTVPCNVFVGHLVGRVGIVGAGDVESDGAEEGIVEERISYQAAWIIGLAGVGIGTKRVAVAFGDGVVDHKVARQLALVVGFDISAMILVEVGEAIVEQNWGTEVVRDVELQLADIGCHVCAGAVVDSGLVTRPGWSLGGGNAVLEIAGDVFGGNGREGGIYRGVGHAVLVLNCELLNLQCSITMSGSAPRVVSVGGVEEEWE